MKAVGTLLLMVVVLCYIQSSLALKCYECAAMVGSGDSCEELNTDYMTSAECPKPLTCIKYNSKIGDKDVLFRACGPKDLCEAKDKGVEKCSTCESDLCNSAVGTTASIFLLVSAFMLKLYY